MKRIFFVALALAFLASGCDYAKKWYDKVESSGEQKITEVVNVVASDENSDATDQKILGKWAIEERTPKNSRHHHGSIIQDDIDQAKTLTFKTHGRCSIGAETISSHWEYNSDKTQILFSSSLAGEVIMTVCELNDSVLVIKNGNVSYKYTKW